METSLGGISFEYFASWEMTGTIYIVNPVQSGCRHVQFREFQGPGHLDSIPTAPGF